MRAGRGALVGAPDSDAASRSAAAVAPHGAVLRTVLLLLPLLLLTLTALTRSATPVARGAPAKPVLPQLHGTLTVSEIRRAEIAVPMQSTDEPHTEVVITEDGLEPPIVAVTAGSLVRWTNETSLPHNTTHLPDLGQPMMWDSGEIEPEGGQFVFRFEEIGNFRYYDALRPEDERYVGTIVVTSNEPTATPLTPTAGPTPTDRPPTQPPSPTPTIPATPTPVPPTKEPVELMGWLYHHSEPGCSEVDAVLVDCKDPNKQTLVRTGGIVDGRLYGWEVRLSGVMQGCSGSAAEYLWLSSAAPAPGACQRPTHTPTSTPPPTPTAPFSEATNLALGRPVTAKSPSLPGFDPSNATDGDTGTVWYHADPEAWIYVDLGETTAFNQIRLRWAYPFAERYGIYVWEEGAWRGKFLADNNSGGDDVRNLAVTQARYILIYLMRSSRASGFALAELEVYGDPQPNWGMGQPVAVSSEVQGYEGRNATDGKPGTWWLSQHGDPNPWIVVYLPESIALKEFHLYWTTEYPRLYSLAFFERGEMTFYTPAIRVDHAGLHPVRGQRAVRADTLMVYTYENDPSGRIGLGEIKIFGPGPVVLGPGAGDDRPVLEVPAGIGAGGTLTEGGAFGLRRPLDIDGADVISVDFIDCGKEPAPPQGFSCAPLEVSPVSGRTILKQDPPPGAGSTHSLPPWASTMPRLTASPRPVPGIERVVSSCTR
jgi:plastocyanin